MTDEIKEIAGVRLVPRRRLAKDLGRTEKTLIRWELGHKGPQPTRVGRDVYYEESAISRWLAKA
jgi:hypothetical protein